MRVAVATLTLLWGSGVAFVPSISSTLFVSSRNQQYLISQNNNKNVGVVALSMQRTSSRKKSKPTFPTPKVRSDSPIPNDSYKARQLLEARRCLLELELVAEKAHDYLEYLDQVAQVVCSYLKQRQEDDTKSTFSRISASETTASDNDDDDIFLPAWHNLQEATDYLDNIEKAIGSASDYLANVQSVQQRIRAFIHKMERLPSTSIQQKQDVHQATFHLEDLQETAQAARDYLGYLQTVSGVVQQYLQDPKLQGIVIEDFMLTIQPCGLKRLQDFLPTSKQQQAKLEGTSLTKPNKVLAPTSSKSSSSTVAKKLPPSYVEKMAAAPHTTIDWSQYKATKQVPTTSPTSEPDDKPQGGTATRMKTVQSAPSTASYLERITVPSATVGKRAVPTSYLEKMDSTMKVETSFVKKDIPTGYLDEMTTNAPLKPIDWSQVKASPVPPETVSSNSDDPVVPVDPSSTSYLERISISAATTASVGKTSVVSSYVDSIMSESNLESKAMPPTYLDAMTASRHTIDWSQFKATTVTDSTAETSHSKKRPPTYLEQATALHEPIDWSQFKATTDDDSSKLIDSIDEEEKASPPSLLDEAHHMSPFKVSEEDVSAITAQILDSARSASSYHKGYLHKLRVSASSTGALGKKTVLASYLNSMASSIDSSEKHSGSSTPSSGTPRVGSYRISYKSPRQSSSASAVASSSYFDSMAASPPPVTESPLSLMPPAKEEPVHWSQFSKASEPETATLPTVKEFEKVAAPPIDIQPAIEVAEVQPASSLALPDPVERREVMAATQALDESKTTEQVQGTLRFFCSRVAPHLTDPQALPKPRDPHWELNDVVRYVPVDGEAKLFWAVTFSQGRKLRRRYQ